MSNEDLKSYAADRLEAAANTARETATSIALESDLDTLLGLHEVVIVCEAVAQRLRSSAG